METIEERAKDWSHIDDYTEDILAVNAYNAYIAGAKEQKAIDEEIKLQKCDDMIQAEYDRKIEERAKDYAYIDWSHIDDYTEDILAVNAYNAYIEGAKEQKAIDDEATLKGFTTDELRAELKRRNAEEKAKKESVLRCRMCRHWGAIDYWGNPGHYLERDTSRSCKFFKTKNGKNYRCHNTSQLACEHFERKEG